MEAPRPQLYGRVPQPVTYLGSKLRLKTGWPSVWLSRAPHSPFFAALLRLQFTTKSPLSVHVRVVLITVRISGFMSRSLLFAVIASMYLPRLNFSAVFPFPKRSYAKPIRGVRSFQL